MGNRYDEEFEFRLATIDDVDNIMLFIKKEWGEKHILANDKELFLWQYGASEYSDFKSINVVLAINKSKEIVGMIGFIPYSNYEKKLHISTAITKTKSKGLIPMTGIELMKRQMKLVGESANFASGTNPETILPIFKKVFGHITGVMKQYYILNLNKEKYNVAIPSTNKTNHTFVSTEYKLEEVYSFDDLVKKYDLTEENEYMSIKAPNYIKKRFFEHPYYNYKALLVINDLNKCVGVLFAREISIENTIILRIVDYRGKLENLEKIGSALNKLISDKDYEYVDLMVSDLSMIDISKSGFQLLDDDDAIIPNYFEPFVRKNVKIYFQESQNIVIFKADGDQDRPNIMRRRED